MMWSDLGFIGEDLAHKMSMRRHLGAVSKRVKDLFVITFGSGRASNERGKERGRSGRGWIERRGRSGRERERERSLGFFGTGFFAEG